jgi:hypothetical protein
MIPRNLIKWRNARKRWCALGLAALASVVLLPAASQAQATRTWVSGVGDDANPCSRTAPCKTFAGAISKTAAGGEINTVDPGAFGTVTITKSISIIGSGQGGGQEVGILSSGTNGIIVNALSTDTVLLQGLDIEGAGTGINGIRVISPSQVYVVNCSIRNHTTYGIDVEAANGARVIVTDSTILKNAGGGIYVKATAGANAAIINRTLLDKNGNFAVKADGPGGVVVNGSILTGSPVGLLSANGGPTVSYGNNQIANGNNPTQTSPLQ